MRYTNEIIIFIALIFLAACAQEQVTKEVLDSSVNITNTSAEVVIESLKDHPKTKTDTAAKKEVLKIMLDTEQ